MGELGRTITRREVLKRGAIVGGGVLWVTPVVQTLTMGNAYAAAVSGDSCTMTLEIVSCQPGSAFGDPELAMFMFKTCIPPGCPCNPMPKGHVVHFYAVASDGTTDRYSALEVPGEPGCYEIEELLAGPAEIYARCGTVSASTGEIDVVAAESAHIQVTAERFSQCQT